MIFRVTFGFRGQSTGWSETHAMLNGSNNPRDLFPTLADIASKRAQFLGQPFVINAIRVSRYATDAGVRAKGVQILKGEWKYLGTFSQPGAEPGNVALICTGYAEPSLTNPKFDANSNRTWLGAPLDASVDDGGRVYEGRGGLGAAFGAWRTAMLNTTIGWLANETIFNSDIDTITQTPQGRVDIKVADTFAGVLIPGQTYKVRVRSVNDGRSPLNRELIATARVGDVLRTREVIGIPTAQVGGAIRAYKQIQPFVDYGDIQLSLEAGKHKRGRPFGSLPGRRAKEVRG